jgi:hypothetical protein
MLASFRSYVSIDVKVTPSQQLILAHEYGPPSGSTSVLAEALGLAATGAVVKRDTAVASRPHATLLLREDGYSSWAGDRADLYRRTQASFSDAPKGVHIDVLA